MRILRTWIFKILVIPLILTADDFAINPDGILPQKSIDFINNVSSELFSKTGVSLYVYMSNDMTKKSYDEFKKTLLRDFKNPFVAIVLIKNAKKIDIAASDNDLLDRDSVYWDYMVPLLPSKDSEITPESLSAVVFNGYVESVDLIASKFGATIEQNIPRSNKGVQTISKVALYGMIFSMFGVIIFIYLTSKRRSNGK